MGSDCISSWSLLMFCFCFFCFFFFVFVFFVFFLTNQTVKINITDRFPSEIKYLIQFILKLENVSIVIFILV